MRASRLLSMLLLLQARGRSSAPSLARELEVSVRTVYRDVDALGAAGVPLHTEAGRDGGIVLRKGWFRTIDHSLKETVDTVLMHSAIWPAQVCRELLLGADIGSVGIESKTQAPLYKYPRNLQFLHFIRRQWFVVARDIFRLA